MTSAEDAFTIEAINDSNSDDVARVTMEAFGGFPWFQALPFAEAQARLAADRERGDFLGVCLRQDNAVRAAAWYLTYSEPDIARLKRGPALWDYIVRNGAQNVLWARSLIVHPDYQGRGFGMHLRSALLESARRDSPHRHVLAELREDNLPTIAQAVKVGYRRTGIVLPCSSKPSTYFEYWHKNLDES